LSNKDSTTKIKRKTLSGGTGDQITMRIRELQNGVTKLISGRPDIVPNDFTLMAKAIHQTNSIIIIEFKEMDRLDKIEFADIESPNKFNETLLRNAQMLLPFKFDKEKMHKDRQYLFHNESITCVTPNGKIFVMGGIFVNEP
jgi:hypothetical protein